MTLVRINSNGHLRAVDDKKTTEKDNAQSVAKEFTGSPYRPRRTV
ncbi:hypothetical protein SAMN05216202_5040 [Pseudomonas mucidolens]|uniref:Uncharacterized protein n=1 Tax=Pseudomonas mucidolens TaxID=46679 RepID=A0A1H2NYK4_9PSED|nr:hypothetical protein SAMN05216202_5040 [Pseudomonas mucidolens]SQH37029.1 Uncharacterised protein [Pseudomonas mucidolens]